MKENKRRYGYLVNFNNRATDKGIRNNPVHFIFYDTETNQEILENKKVGHKKYTVCNNTLQMGWACYWNRETDETEWIFFEKIEKFNRFVKRILSKTAKKQVWFVAHNINFDNTILDIQSYFDDRGFETDFIHAKGMVFLQKLALRKIKKVKDKNTGEIKEKKETQKVVMFVNNGNIFPTTLKNIGETIGLGKMQVDFEEDSFDYIRTYCKRDVEILLEFWRQWCDFIDENQLGNIKYTISSQSMEAFKKRFCNEYVVLDDDMENLEFERKAYYGGRTEIFYKGKVRKPIKYFDVNSMYPHVMKSYRYPTEFKFFKMSPSIEDMKHYIHEKGWLVMAECYINTKNNCYPCKKNNTLLFPTGKFITYLATPEVIEGLENGDIEKFGRVSFYHGANLFDEYVTFFYNKRVELKKQGNKQEKMYKLFLNSLYGKFGQMMDSWIPCTIDDIKLIDANFDFDKWMMDEYKLPRILVDGLNSMLNIRYIGGQLQLSAEKEESQISFPAIASHVTSYARLILWRAIKYCQDRNLKYYYCDTDSIFVQGDLPPEMVDDNELGKLKIEKIFPHGVEFMNLKNYCAINQNGKKYVARENPNCKVKDCDNCDNKDCDDGIEKITLDEETFLKESKVLKGKTWKMKGVSNNAQMLDENTFIVQEWGGLAKQEYYKKFGRKKGEFWVIYKKKSNHNKINKGTVLTNGDIVPFELEEF